MRVHFVFVFFFLISICAAFKLSEWWEKNWLQVKGKQIQMTRAYAGVQRDVINCNGVIACCVDNCGAIAMRVSAEPMPMHFYSLRSHVAANWKGLGHQGALSIMQNTPSFIDIHTVRWLGSESQIQK